MMWLNLKIIMLSERSQTVYDSTKLSSRKCKPIDSNRKQINVCVGTRVEKGLYANWLKQIFRVDRNVPHIDCSGSFVGLYKCQNESNCVL